MPIIPLFLGSPVPASFYYTNFSEAAGLEKNVAGQKWIVFAFNRNTNAALTGDAANITANLRLDGGAANAVDDVNPTELEDGYYIFDISQAESNADLILIAPASTTSSIQVIGVPGSIYTVAPNTNAQVISSAGAVDSIVQGYLNTLLTEATAGRIAGNINTFFENSDLATIKIVDNVGGGAAGPGSTSCTFTINDSNGQPISGAEVWASTDLAGANVVAGTLTTDDIGQVTFLLDSGVTYYIWRDHPNFNFTNPQLTTVP